MIRWMLQDSEPLLMPCVQNGMLWSNILIILFYRLFVLLKSLSPFQEFRIIIASFPTEKCSTYLWLKMDRFHWDSSCSLLKATGANPERGKSQVPSILWYDFCFVNQCAKTTRKQSFVTGFKISYSRLHFFRHLISICMQHISAKCNFTIISWKSVDLRELLGWYSIRISFMYAVIYRHISTDL